jgi:hypothetical protein
MQFGLKGGMTKRTFLLQPGRNNSTQPWNLLTKIWIC